MPPRIHPLDDESADADARRLFAIAEERGAPNSVLLRIMARDPDSMRTFYQAWNRSFYEADRIDHGLKEMVRVRMARVRACGY